MLALSEIEHKNFDISDLIGDNIRTDGTKIYKALEDCYRLRGYLSRNWKFIKPIAKRSLGDSMSGIGVSESTHRPFSY